MIQNALHAIHVFKRDVDYMVAGGDIRIVDPNTRRIHDERRWPGGLHQAVEISEKLLPSPETETGARITRQRY